MYKHVQLILVNYQLSFTKLFIIDGATELMN